MKGEARMGNKYTKKIVVVIQRSFLRMLKVVLWVQMIVDTTRRILDTIWSHTNNSTFAERSEALADVFLKGFPMIAFVVWFFLISRKSLREKEIERRKDKPREAKRRRE